ncbi:hypothetical protein GCM10022297_16960 [Lactobacillus hamsteri]|uniref:Mucus binding protein Mub n=1 Tax=Lactobacillus hamsteri DSM 5661 = JCM 6256 TaxID=1423754 RepID=A0A0R1YF66_9LACO|nr:YSIRK signal domain/LPXTG anchor domain surface protein [Lactobacillus hamsteri]KRM40863.1 mucus binding protein precursor Mub [Lactobacillus hamsteri DSM 5661 = JCM 6256]
MVSRKNIQEKLRKIEEKRERHSIRKFTVGAASVLIGLTFMGMASQQVKASEITQDTVAVENSTIDSNSEANNVATEEVAVNNDSVGNSEVTTEPIENEVSESSASVTENNNSSSADNSSVVTESTKNESSSVAGPSTSVSENENSSQVETSTPNQENNINQVQTEKTEDVKKPSYEDSKAEVDKINGEINKDLEDVVNKAEEIDGVTVDKKDPNKVTTGTTDIDKNKAEIIANNKKQIEEILKALEEHKAALKDYEGKLDEYNKKRDEYIQQLKDLGLWDENEHIDPDKLSQLLIFGKEENATVTVKPLNPNVVQGTGSMLNGLLNNFWQVNDTVHGDFLQVTYTDLKNSFYAGELISKIEITYSDFIMSNHPSQNNRKPGIYFGKSPTDGFFYVKAESVTMGLKMYDANGKLITLGENTAYITIGSLNSKGEGNDYVEKAEIINGSSHKGEGVALPESSVTIHKGPNGDILYSDKNNELLYDKNITDAERELAIKIWGKDIVDKYLGWDDSKDRSKEIFGSGLFKVSGDGIKIKFSNKLGSAWATFSTTIPKITFDAEKPEKPTTTITWQPGQLVLNKNSSAHIHYVDVNGAVLNGVTNFTPEHGFELSDQKQSHEHLAIGDKYDNILWNWEEAGYILATDTVHPGATNGVITDDVQHIYVYLKHKTETVNRDKEVNQTIHYVYEDGTTAAPDHVSIKLVFTQTGVKNLVTGQIDWNGEWTKTQTFVTVVSPTIDGYTTDRPEVGPYDIIVDNSNFNDNLDKVDTVVYTKNPSPDKPEIPEDPTTPEIPDKPEVPENPTNPEQPTIPEDPTTPDTPEVPEDDSTSPGPEISDDVEESVSPLPEKTPSNEETVTPKSQDTSKETSKVATISSKNEKNAVLTNLSTGEKSSATKTAESDEAALPQTGEKDTNKAGMFGALIAVIGSLFGLAQIKKRKKNN